jgi:hypothetical protein
MKRFKTILFLIVLLSFSVSSFAAWNYYGEILLPTSSPDCRWPIVLAADDANDILYIGMFNDSGGSTARGVARLTLSAPGTGTYQEIHTRTSDNGRGFCGLSYDSSGDNLYITGDSSSTVSYIDRIASPGTGTAPTVTQDWATPTFRSVGCSLLLDNNDSTLYLMVSELIGGGVHAYKTTDASLDATSATLSGNYARDIAVNPSDYKIYCNRNGNLQEISGGSPSNMSGYGTGSDILAGTNTDAMQWASGCYISYNNAAGAQIVWNNADTGASGGDNITVTYLDGSPAKDETLSPTGSSTSTTWNFATDSEVLNIGGNPYLYVLDLSGTTPRLVIFEIPPPVTMAISWEMYE